MLGFFPAVLTITAGAKAGSPFDPLWWHVFSAGSLFGWRNSAGRMRFRNGWLETGKGQAKALALDTPIPTPSGWTTMGALVDGDTVLGADGAPCRVLKAHSIVTGQDCYRLTFDDGSMVVANAGHLWRTEMRKSGALGHGDATRGVPLNDRGGWRQGVRTTAEIAATVRYKNGPHQSANHSVALTGEISLPDADLPLPPYALGYWLGDGDSDCARVTIGDRDAEEAARLMTAVGVCVGNRQGHGSGAAGRYSINLSGAIVRDGFGARLKRLGLLGAKHIPAIYLRASASQRRALLMGLMDTDGTVTAGQCSFTSVSERLAVDVHELVVSLGIKATLVRSVAKLRGVDICAAFRVNFYSDGRSPVFGLNRKQDRVAPTHGRRRLSGDRKIIRCEMVASVPVRCISVDSPDSMFLCSRAMIPTHNSPLMAAIGLYLMGYYGIARSEIYSIGQDRATANVLFKDATAMCRAPIPVPEGEELDEADTMEARGEVVIRGELDNAWKIEHPESNSKFQSLANGEAISGPRPTAVLADEIHEFKSAHSIETWKRAIAKMPGDALMLLGTNTPATTQLVGTDYSEFYQKVAKGEIVDDEAFAFIARVDKADREAVFDNEACWQKALPALGITFPVENIRGEVNTARVLLSTAMSVKRLYFGIPIGSADFWIAEEAWAAVQGPVDPEDMRGLPCWLALDLSQKNDLTALTAAWQGDDGHLFAKTWYWTTRAGLEDRAKADQAPYDQWVAQGHMEAVPGAVIDKTFVAAKVAELCAEHDVQMLAFDVAGMADFISACDQIGFEVWRWKGENEEQGSGLKMMSHAQGTRVMFEDRQLCMPRSIERLEDRILTRGITVDASPVTYSCAANAQIIADGQKNRAFDKRKSRGRIDGMVTLAMATGAALAVESAPAANEPQIFVF